MWHWRRMRKNIGKIFCCMSKHQIICSVYSEEPSQWVIYFFRLQYLYFMQQRLVKKELPKDSSKRTMFMLSIVCLNVDHKTYWLSLNLCLNKIYSVCQLSIYKTVGSNVSCFSSLLLPFKPYERHHILLGVLVYAPILHYLLVPSLQIINSWNNR